ncbi:hypothetical protein B0H13DRAFT_2676200 [Mycena leptocephala]|nr:hypothetical protein B0H13DRAFT_2676200 [Mycena leptocephala]
MLAHWRAAALAACRPCRVFFLSYFLARVVLTATLSLFPLFDLEFQPPPVPTPTAPFPPPSRPTHALRARLLSWFPDAPAAPFGVHRMALAGKAVGKDVGMWFGPSAAAGALRTLVDAFPAAGLGVSVATDGTLYQTEMFVASHSPIAASVSSHGSRGRGSSSGHSKGGKDAQERGGAIDRCCCCWRYDWGWRA